MPSTVDRVEIVTVELNDLRRVVDEIFRDAQLAIPWFAGLPEAKARGYGRGDSHLR